MTEKLNIGDFGLCEFKIRGKHDKEKLNFLKYHVHVREKDKYRLLLEDNDNQHFLPLRRDVKNFIVMPFAENI